MGKSDLKIGSVEINGEALLVSGDHGMVLGCDSITIGGQKADKPADDFEFVLTNGALASTIPIHRPISPVKIGPDVNVFTDSR